MSSDEIREKYLKFFEARGHVRIDPSPLVLENDPTTLFTSSGMQQLVPYLKGESHPKGRRLVDSQPSLRLQDIDEVGDKSHTTFFEMLGNWSLGDYFKEEQLVWCWEFFTKELSMDPEKLYVSVFEGARGVPKDTESVQIWKKIGVPEKRIFYYGVDKNWWSRSGTPKDMPQGEIGGPDSEVFYDFGIPHDPKYGNECHPNCQCGRFLEIGNSVFIQYEKSKDGSLTELPQKNVDFGGGLERITAVVNGNPDIFDINLFKPIITTLKDGSRKAYEGNERSMRIIADHLRASAVLISEGVIPSNKTQGYVLRRLLRRSIMHMMFLGGIVDIAGTLIGAVRSYTESNNLKFSGSEEDILKSEGAKYIKALERGMKKMNEAESERVNGKFVFDLYQTEGLPLEFALDFLAQKNKKFDESERAQIISEFESYQRKHQKKSRTASAGMFKGGLADKSEQVTKLHTATHLLHAALRKVLGEHVSQKGSNITAERLRFDFSHPEKLTDEEIKKVEDLVNEQIKKDLAVSFAEKFLDEAIKEGALHFFGEHYGERVKVYTIGAASAQGYGEPKPFSREVCGGPHVSHTGEIGRVKIIKQEKVGAGVMRIYATVV